MPDLPLAVGSVPAVLSSIVLLGVAKATTWIMRWTDLIFGVWQNPFFFDKTLYPLLPTLIRSLMKLVRKGRLSINCPYLQHGRERKCFVHV